MAKKQNTGEALGEDLELRADDAAEVKGGRYPIEPGEDWSGFVRRIVRKKKKAAARKFFPGGGRPV